VAKTTLVPKSVSMCEYAYGLSVSIVERQCGTRKGEKRRQMKMITCPDDVTMTL